MGWRIVQIESPCKLAYKNNYMLIRSDKDKLIYIPEIDVLMINTPQVVFTSVLLIELVKNKVKIIWCDEKHNPCAEIVDTYGCFNSSRKIFQQTLWMEECKSKIATKIIRQKIINQSRLLERLGKREESILLQSYAQELLPGDVTNREGFAAKVYFNALFGKSFCRDGGQIENAALNYGYTILLSYINRAVVQNGYLTQLGLHHFNEYNYFNLSCDFIEPFRVVVDEFVYFNKPIDKLTPEYKQDIAKIFLNRVKMERECFLSDAINAVVRNNLKCLSENTPANLILYEN